MSRNKQAPPILRLTLVAIVVGTACVGLRPDQTTSKPLELHVEFRSGGDAPLGFQLSVFKDATARYLATTGRSSWVRQDAEDSEALQDLATSSEFGLALDTLRARSRPFGCCDFRELGIYTKPTEEAAPAVLEPTSELPGTVQELITTINRIGAKYFRRVYSSL